MAVAKAPEVYAFLDSSISEEEEKKLGEITASMHGPKRVLQGYNSSLTMLGVKTQHNNSNQISENKSSLPNDEMSQVGSDLDDEIPF